MGGGGTDSPLAPHDDSKQGSEFQDVWNIFGFNTDDDPEIVDPLVAQEVDMAPIVWGANSGGPAGDPVTDLEGNSFVAVVSRIDAIIGGESVEEIIELKFFAMRQQQTQVPIEPVMYTEIEPQGLWGPEIGYQFNLNPGYRVSAPDEHHCQSPRVTSRVVVVEPGDNYRFEVLVAYEVTDGINDTISVYRGYFRMARNPFGALTIMKFCPDYINWTQVTSHTGGDCEFPEIETSPVSPGNTHLVYVDFNASENNDAKIIHRQRYDYTSDFGQWTWLNEFDGGANGWAPRIDIGTVRDPFGFEDPPPGDVTTVAVVYTRQELDPDDPGDPPPDYYGFVPYVRYWREDVGPVPPDLWENSFQRAIINEEWFPDEEGFIYGSGLPVIDISPESDDDHDAYIAFVQQVTHIPLPTYHAIYIIGHAFQGEELVLNFHALTSTNGDQDAVLPSMCIHQGIRQLSITYYVRDSDSTRWTLAANRVDYLGDPVVMVQTPINTTCLGSFNIGELQTFNLATTSGISSTLIDNQPSYFAAWSDSVGVVCEPLHIEATFGYTEPFSE